MCGNSSEPLHVPQHKYNNNVEIICYEQSSLNGWGDYNFLPPTQWLDIKRDKALTIDVNASVINGAELLCHPVGLRVEYKTIKSNKNGIEMDQLEWNRANGIIMNVMSHDLASE